MSAETINWLNQNTLIGFTEKRGQAWHHRASAQGTESNHYRGAVPLADVRRRLFSWKAIAVPMYVDVPNKPYMQVPSRVAIVRDDNYSVLGTPSTSYALHQYEDALLSNIENILDDDINIGSAGLLKNGAVAWVQIEMPENIKGAGGVEFRPNLLATTSFNGSIATTYKRTVTIVVCDNTRAAALQEDGQDFRVRHTANSVLRLDDARQALNIVYEMGDAFGRELEQLLAVKVTDKQWEAFLSDMFPVKEDAAQQAHTKVDKDKEVFRTLWTQDDRVTPWRNTAFGVLQAVNTHRQYIRPLRGGTLRVERNMMDTLTGYTEESDQKAMSRLFALVK